MIRDSLLAQQPFTIRHAVVTGFAILRASLGNPDWPRLLLKLVDVEVTGNPAMSITCRTIVQQDSDKARVKALYDGCRIHVVHLAATKAAMSHRAGTGDAPIPGLVTSRLGTQCDE